MADFSYVAKNEDGRTQRGVLEAARAREAVARLWDRGYTVINVRPTFSVARLSDIRLGRRRVNQQSLALFCRQFATMIGAGVSILESLRILSRQQRKKDLRELLEEVAQDLEGGSTLSDAFAAREGAFPPILVNMVNAGEVGGILEEVFDRLATHFDKEAELNAKIRSATVYPKLVLAVAVAVVGFLVTCVIPQFGDMFRSMGATLPVLTLGMLGFSEIVRDNVFYILAGGLFAWLAVSAVCRVERVAFWLDKVKLRLPVFGELELKRCMARFARTQGTLLKSGVPILQSVEVVGDAIGNRYIGSILSEVQQSIRQGHSMALPMQASPVFPPMLAEMVSVGEETGSLEEMLFKAADFFEREVDIMVERFTALLEPVIVICLGGVVAFVLISMYMPIFEVIKLVQ